MYTCMVSLMSKHTLFSVFSLEGFDGKIPFDFLQWIHFEKCCDFTKEVKGI